MNIVQIIKEVPDTIFTNCLQELSKIDWNNVIDDRKRGVFATSTALHLRSHETSEQKTKPNSIETFSEIIECRHNKNVILNFLEHYKTAIWIKEQVNGISIGRVMIVRLEPMSEIGLHTDPGPYFEKYSRYHIPLKTNQSVVFIDEHNNQAHMPIKTLCRLNNLSPHGLINDSHEERIHLIVDIETSGGNSVF